MIGSGRRLRPDHGPRRNEPEPGMGVEHPGGMRERTWFPPGVVVAERDVRCAGEPDADVAPEGPMVPLEWDDANAGVAGAYSRDGAVTGSVVDHDDGGAFG